MSTFIIAKIVEIINGFKPLIDAGIIRVFVNLTWNDVIIIGRFTNKFGRVQYFLVRSLLYRYTCC